LNNFIFLRCISQHPPVIGSPLQSRSNDDILANLLAIEDGGYNFLLIGKLLPSAMDLSRPIAGRGVVDKLCWVAMAHSVHFPAGGFMQNRPTR
ncbi:hypothetical protein INR49_017018, partial [Caranx melampygus]